MQEIREELHIQRLSFEDASEQVDGWFLEGQSRADRLSSSACLRQLFSTYDNVCRACVGDVMTRAELHEQLHRVADEVAPTLPAATVAA